MQFVCKRKKEISVCVCMRERSPGICYVRSFNFDKQPQQDFWSEQIHRPIYIDLNFKSAIMYYFSALTTAPR